MDKHYGLYSFNLDGFKLAGLQEKHAVATWTWDPSQYLLEDWGKPRNVCRDRGAIHYIM